MRETGERMGSMRVVYRCPRLMLVMTLLIGAIAIFLHSMLVHAAATTVTATIFTDPPPGQCATTGIPPCSIREAFMYVDTQAFGLDTTITLLPGTYTLAIPPSASSPNDPAHGSLKLRTNATIIVADGGTATIDANELDRVLEIELFANQVSISNVIFRNGVATMATAVVSRTTSRT